MPEDWRKRQGCNGVEAEAVARLPDGSLLYECPGRNLSPSTVRACTLYGHFKEGHSIASGTILGESATMMQAFGIIGAEVARRQNEELEHVR